MAQHDSAAHAISIVGEEIQVTPSAILPLALIPSELCTSATKYGALSCEGGIVTLGWTQDIMRGAPVLTWIEQGGPLIGARGETGVQYALTVPLEKLQSADIVI